MKYDKGNINDIQYELVTYSLEFLQHAVTPVHRQTLQQYTNMPLVVWGL